MPPQRNMRGDEGLGRGPEWTRTEAMCRVEKRLWL